MSLDHLLNELSRLGVRLRADGEGLEVQAPPGVLTAELRRALGESKGEILALLRPRNGERGGPLAPDRDRLLEPFPLTDIQQAYWIGRTAAIELGRVGCHYYQELEGTSLDLPRLESSLQRLIEHHGMLRAIVELDGRQRILERVPAYRIDTLDLRGSDPESARRALLAVRERLSRHVYAPDRWPLFAVSVTRLDGGRLRIHLSFDLLVLDATSLARLLLDWQALYADPESLQPLDLSFRDYVLAEMRQRDSTSYQSALAYWNERLATLPPAPDLPRPRVGADLRQAVARRRRQSALDAERWLRLKRRAGALGLTSSALLVAVWSEVLAVWSGSFGFTLNVTFNQRRPVHPEVHLLLGDFTTTILLEVDLRPASFAERAHRLWQRFSADLDHAEVSGVEVLRRRQRLQGASEPISIVFTSLLGRREAGGELLFTPHWLGKPVYGISQTPQVSLDHMAFEWEGQLGFLWDSADEVFPDGVLDDMFAAYEALLRRLADDESAWRAAHLDMVPEHRRARRAQVDAAAAPRPAGLLHTAFAEQARERPEAPAVLSSLRRLSYGELDRRSQRVAQELISRGVAPGRLVAIVMEKGWEQVVAVLGILRAGAAYVPIAADLPAARRADLLHRCEVDVVLTQARIDDRLEWPAGIRRLRVDELPDERAALQLPLPEGTADDLAYVIFTSGSTGRPKGVMISHGAALNTVVDVDRRFGAGPEDRVLALSSLGFDLSVYDVFGPLSRGGAIVMPDAGTERDPEHWARRILEDRVTVWNSVPALMKMLVEHSAGRMTFPSLRLALLSGDWIPVSLPDRIRSLGSAIRVVSLGGATEASIWSILWPADRVDPAWSSLPYGRPMDRQAFHVLDEHLRPCPDWVVGELFIGGDGLAMGYWQSAEETAYRFIPDPVTGGRLFRTGDLGRALGDGNLEILGRKDFQVKIQGNRVELGEIEACLLAHETVREAVVAARQDSWGQAHLAAYVVSAVPVTEPGAWAAALQRHLGEHLPAYMVPAAWVPLDALPLSANGKIDRSRLPDPSVRPAAAPVEGPPTDLERRLIPLIEEVLERTGIQPRDRFADLGSNSLHVVRIHRRLREALGVEIPIARMFECPTVRALAQALHRAPASEPGGIDLGRIQRSRAEAARRRQQAEGLS